MLRKIFDIIAGVTFYYVNSCSSKKLHKLQCPSFTKIDAILAYGYCPVRTSSDIYTFCGKGDFKLFRCEGKDSEQHKYDKKIVLPENAVVKFACCFMKHIFVFIKSFIKKTKYNKKIF